MVEDFLQFVASRGLLTTEQLKIVRTQLRTAPEPIGMLAFRHGMISGADIDRVLEAQRHDGRVFGELAVEMGLLTTEQIQALLCVQRYRYAVEVAEALALSGLVPPGRILPALGEFLSARAECTDASTPTEASR